MNSKLRGTGYLQIDHRDSPGLNESQIIQLGAPMPLNEGQSNFETDVVKCWHCQTMIIINPLRTRKRTEFCGGCGRYLCPKCYLTYKVTGVCKPFTKVLDEIHEAAVLASAIKEI